MGILSKILLILLGICIFVLGIYAIYRVNENGSNLNTFEKILFNIVLVLVLIMIFLFLFVVHYYN